MPADQSALLQGRLRRRTRWAFGPPFPRRGQPRLHSARPRNTTRNGKAYQMRQHLTTMITRARALEIDDVNHHIIAGGYLVTGMVFDGHSTLVMTVVYLWAGFVHTNTLRATHLSAFVPHRRRATAVAARAATH
jgi:hypothetical protein